MRRNEIRKKRDTKTKKERKKETNNQTKKERDIIANKEMGIDQSMNKQISFLKYLTTQTNKEIYLR